MKSRIFIQTNFSMKPFLLFISFFCAGLCCSVQAQNITYSEVEKSDTRNLSFEILGKFTDHFLVYKNGNRRHEFTIYDNNMSVKENIRHEFISDRATNISFITYPDHFLMFWQFDKGNITRYQTAKFNASAGLIGTVTDLDEFRTALFSNKSTYSLAWSEDKKKILLSKIQDRNDVFDLSSKVFDENLKLLDSSKKVFNYNDRREIFGDAQIDNDGTCVFTKIRHNALVQSVNSLEVYQKKMKADTFSTVKIPFEKHLIQDPFLKIDNLNKRYLINSFSYKRSGGNTDGLFTAVLNSQPFTLVNSATNIFSDTLISKLSGKPGWRMAFDNFNLRNIILKKDGGFMAVSEQYYKQRRFGTAFDDRFAPGIANYRFNSASDYYLYNRGYNGYYRPFNDSQSRDIVYHYNDIISFSFTKDLKLQWNNVINKTTSDVENDNFLSFGNMNAGGEIHFLFLQKDNNRQIISDHGLQPDGSVKRYATLKGREAGYYFMPRLARQTGLRQMIIPCIVRNNLAFAKIDF